VELSPAADACADCGGRLRRIGEDVTEELEYVPGRFIVNRIVRPRLACTGCERFVQAPLPSRPIDRGRPIRRLAGGRPTRPISTSRRQSRRRRKKAAIHLTAARKLFRQTEPRLACPPVNLSLTLPVAGGGEGVTIRVREGGHRIVAGLVEFPLAATLHLSAPPARAAAA
jgi:hypothetical protein